MFAAEALDVLITAEDQFGLILTDEQRELAAPESIDPLSWLDPALAQTLTELEPPKGER